MALVLDAGALVALERGDLRVKEIVQTAQDEGEVVLVSSGCVAQTWRTGGPKQAILARLLKGTTECELGPTMSRAVGGLCAATRTSDVVDAHVALLANDGDVILTSDPSDLEKLLKTTKTKALIARC